jgi:hypothetical protein
MQFYNNVTVVNNSFQEFRMMIFTCSLLKRKQDSVGKRINLQAMTGVRVNSFERRELEKKIFSYFQNSEVFLVHTF